MPLKDSRIKKTKVGKDSETMYRVITVFSVSETLLNNKTENPYSHQNDETVNIMTETNFKNF